MKNQWYALVLATGLLGAGWIEVGPSAAQVPIRQLRSQRGITISGTVGCIVGNNFVLDDGTGQVVVDAGPRWYYQLDLRPGERVTVVGKFDDDDFDAFTITRANGEVLQIRNPEGPPPWSGSRRPR